MNGIWFWRTLRLLQKICDALPAPQKIVSAKCNALNGIECGIFRDEPNVLVLDHADIIIDGALAKQNEFVLLGDVFLRETLGKEGRCGHMFQPYLQEKSVPEKVLDLQLKYSFECQEVPETEYHLVLEHPEFYSITLNGKELQQIEDGFWIDPVLQKLKIPAGYLQPGKNQLILSGKYHENLPGLESLFLLGEFGVFDEKIGKLPTAIQWGDWCAQGFPYYGGNFTYRMSLKDVQGDKAFLSIQEWRGTAIGVKVNGSTEQILLAPPYRMELTDYLNRDGKDEVEICVYGHRRNVFGPFYSHEKWHPWTGPAQFKIYETPQRQTVPCGLLSAPCIETI